MPTNEQPSPLNPQLPTTDLEVFRQQLIPTTSSEKALPSSAINKAKLVSPQVVINKYSKLRGNSKAGTLAQKLAKEAFFGEAVMVECTVHGCRDHPGLPTAKLHQLKSTIQSLFPQYWTSPVEMESIWGSCVDSIGQACKRLRHKKRERAVVHAPANSLILLTVITTELYY